MDARRQAILQQAFSAGYAAYKKASAIADRPEEYPFLMGLTEYLRVAGYRPEKLRGAFKPPPPQPVQPEE